MEYLRQPNLLLEALAFLGRRANGNTWEELEQRVQRKKIPVSPSFRHTFSKLKALTSRLNKKTDLPDETLHRLFDNLEGMPHNTIGSGSPAFLLFYSGLERYHGNLDELAAELKEHTPAETAYAIAQALDLTEDSTYESIDSQTFLQQILSQAFPDRTKLAVLSLFADHASFVDETVSLLRPLLSLLEEEQEAILSITADFDAEIHAMGCQKFLAEFSHLKPDERTSYILRPFLFGMDTNLSSDIARNKVCIYCGILRKALQDMLNSQNTSDSSVYEAFRLLGDRTRFDILCYLRDHSVYSQELCTHFNLSRNTIHHHMSKLIASNLVQCTIDGNRVYYSLDMDTIRLLIQKQEELFCNKPEN